MNARPLLIALAVAASSPAQAATPPPAGGVVDVLGPRTLSLGGGVGVASGNEGLFVNPGAPAARKRYSLDTLFAVDRRGGTNAGQWLGASVVDSTTASVTGSFGYLKLLGGAQTGSVMTAGLAGAVADKLYVGAQGRYYQLGGPEKVDAVSADAGLFWEVADSITFGAAGYNLVPTNHLLALPRGAGAGLALGSDTGVKLTVDWHGDFDRTARTTNRYAVGAEALLASLVPVRVAWQRDETLDTSWWCAGVGLVTQGGVALDVGYRQSIKDSSARTIAVSLKLYPEL